MENQNDIKDLIKGELNWHKKINSNFQNLNDRVVNLEQGGVGGNTNTFTGTKAQVEEAIAAGKIPVGTIVNITDDYVTESGNNVLDGLSEFEKRRLINNIQIGETPERLFKPYSPVSNFLIVGAYSQYAEFLDEEFPDTNVKYFWGFTEGRGYRYVIYSVTVTKKKAIVKIYNTVENNGDLEITENDFHLVEIDLDQALQDMNMEPDINALEMSELIPVGGSYMKGIVYFLIANSYDGIYSFNIGRLSRLNKNENAVTWNNIRSFFNNATTAFGPFYGLTEKTWEYRKKDGTIITLEAADPVFS